MRREPLRAGIRHRMLSSMGGISGSSSVDADGVDDGACDLRSLCIREPDRRGEAQPSCGDVLGDTATSEDARIAIRLLQVEWAPHGTALDSDVLERTGDPVAQRTGGK